MGVIILAGILKYCDDMIASRDIQTLACASRTPIRSATGRSRHLAGLQTPASYRGMEMASLPRRIRRPGRR